MIKKIVWNGFLKAAVENYPNESCAFLFSHAPYTDHEEWWVFPVKNVSENPREEWIPDKKEMLKVKKEARTLGFVKIGNIHTHPYPKNKKYDEDFMKEFIQPSNKDLMYARE